jgi:hypothetical protein
LLAIIWPNEVWKSMSRWNAALVEAVNVETVFRTSR